MEQQKKEQVKTIRDLYENFLENYFAGQDKSVFRRDFTKQRMDSLFVDYLIKMSDAAVMKERLQEMRDKAASKEGKATEAETNEIDETSGTMTSGTDETISEEDEKSEEAISETEETQEEMTSETDETSEENVTSDEIDDLEAEYEEYEADFEDDDLFGVYYEDDEEEVLNGTVALINRISEYLEHTPYEEFERSLQARIVGQTDGVRDVATCVYNYLKSIVDGNKNGRRNFIITAPSGCGKTETYRVLKELLSEIQGFSVGRADLSNLTERGYKGNDLEMLFTDMWELRKIYDMDQRGIGIVFLDEFDKKLMPSYSGKGENINLNVQNQLLTVIEGADFEGKFDNNTAIIDTTYTLFVGLGSFDQARNMRTEEECRTTIGFSNVNQKKDKQEEHYRPITLEMMRETGACNELLGRFSTIINYKPIDKKTQKKMLNRILEDFCQQEGIRATFSEKGYAEFMQEVNGPLGWRKVSNAVWNTLMPVVRDKLLGKNAERYVICGVNKVKKQRERTNCTEPAEVEEVSA